MTTTRQETTVPLFTDEDLAEQFVALPKGDREGADWMKAVRLASWDSGAVLLDDLIRAGATQVAFDLGPPPALTDLYPIDRVRERFWGAPGNDPGRYGVVARAYTA